MAIGPRHDVIVIGAGLAGLRAARDLAEAGRTVLVLEARNRVGGRGWSSPFPGTDELVELGGAWFTEHQPLVRAEIDRYGLGVREFAAPTSTRWRTSGELRLDAPFVDEDRECVAAIERLQADAKSFAAGDAESRFTLSLDDYLDTIEAPQTVRDLAHGWWPITGGGIPSEGCVEGLLSAMVAEGPIGDMRYLRYSPQPGWSALAEAMAFTDAIDVEFGQAAMQVFHDESSVTVRTAHSVFTAYAAVIATPVNVLPRMLFSPSLPDRIADGGGASTGKAIKVWMRVRDVPEGALGFGRGKGLNWFYGDRSVNGDTLVVAFGWPTEGFDPTSDHDVADALAAFFPDAELLSHTSHDWITDPASRGTWVNAPSGNPEVLRAENFAPTGRLAFATSDIASEHSGWFEGALVSGSRAAVAIHEMLT